MSSEDLKVLCRKATERIQRIPFSEWGETELIARVLYDEFAPAFDVIRRDQSFQASSDCESD